MTGVVEHLSALKSAGASRVLVTSVNDAHVLTAFAKPFAAHAPFLDFMADPDAEFAHLIGAAINLSAAGLGWRSNRYVLVVDRGVIQHQLVEEKPAVVQHTHAKFVVPLLSRSVATELEKELLQAFANGKSAQVMINANRMAVVGAKFSTAVYSAMVQTATRHGFIEAANAFIVHWRRDKNAVFSEADDAACKKWIAAAPKEPILVDEADLFNDSMAHARATMK